MKDKEQLIERLVEQYVENDELKFNIVIFSNSKYQELNTLFTYHKDINEVKKEKELLEN